ncbi:MAG: type I-U CRISPR-associated protein Cas7 [Actinobacteria bacterium]|nr:type I-U CRISPR-associated protein Cas7 [Actinomycetota bacterium]
MPDRQHLDVRLQPLAGARFQPTGFPDVGPALFQRPVGEHDWQDCLLLESAQSMANHLEATSWDEGVHAPVSAFADLPYVRVVGTDGGYLTSSRTEPHRLAAGFVKDSALNGVNMRNVIKERLGLRDDSPRAPRDIALAVFALDPMCLVHGVFFAESAKVWPGQPKVARALTAFVEAHDVRPAVSGGVKRDDVRHSVADTGGAKEGYGFVPFHRTEYVARDIVASFALDLDQLASYGLPEPATALLAAAARWEVRRLLDGGFRPRTACDLTVVDTASVDAVLPPLEQLTDELSTLVGRCGDLLAGGEPMVVTWDGGKAKPKKAAT